MTRYLIAAVTVALLIGCTPTQQTDVTTGLATVPGQLFCAIIVGSGQIVAPIISAKATTAGGSAAGAAAILVTGETAAVVQQQCALAAASVGGKGAVPVSPPPNAGALAPVAI